MTLDSTNAQLEIRRYQAGDEPAVVELWRQCGLVVPWNDPNEEIAIKMAYQPELFLVGTLADRVVATVMAGYEGHRGWINYLAVSPEHQRQGIGSRMMLEAEEVLWSLGCPKINLQVRETNKGVIAFYERLGFSHDRVISLGKRLKGERSNERGG